MPFFCFIIYYWYYYYYYNKTAFRFYDKEGNTLLGKIIYYWYNYNATAFRFYNKEVTPFYVKSMIISIIKTKQLSDYTTK